MKKGVDALRYKNNRIKWKETNSKAEYVYVDIMTAKPNWFSMEKRLKGFQ